MSPPHQHEAWTTAIAVHYSWPLGKKFFFETTHFKRNEGSLKVADIFETLVMIPLEDRLVSEDENAQRASKLYLLYNSSNSFSPACC